MEDLVIFSLDTTKFSSFFQTNVSFRLLLDTLIDRAMYGFLNIKYIPTSHMQFFIKLVKTNRSKGEGQKKLMQENKNIAQNT